MDLQDVNGGSSSGSSASSFPCRDCGVKFLTEQGLSDHRRLIHPQCNKCGRAFGSQAALLNHRKDSHAYPSSIENSLPLLGTNRRVPALPASEGKSLSLFPSKNSFLPLADDQETVPPSSNSEQTGQPAQQLVVNLQHSEDPQAQRFKCKDCKWKFGLWAAFVEHMRRTHSRGFVCRECRIGFYSEFALKVHRRDHQRNREGQRLPRFVSDKHLGQDSNQAPSWLNHGSNQASTGGSSQTSNDGSHEVSNQVMNQALNTESGFFCRQCQKAFVSQAALESHSRTSAAHAQDGKRFACRECSKEFVSRASLVQHLSSTLIHIQNRFACEVCGDVFPNQAELNRHRLVLPSHAEKFLCNQCERSFDSRTALEQHARDSSVHRLRSPVGQLQPNLSRELSRLLVKPSLEQQEGSSTNGATEISDWRNASGVADTSLLSGSFGQAFQDGENYVSLEGLRIQHTGGPSGGDLQLGLHNGLYASGSVKDDTIGSGKRAEECIICLDAPRDTLYLPCGHFSFCHECALLNQEKGNACPECRSPIETLFKIFS